MLLPANLDRFVAETAPAHDDIQERMATHAADGGFPIIGQVAGSYLWSLARTTNAESVFEFGSGFGYSASWFLKGMSASGTIVLTEIDADELELAKTYLSEAGTADNAVFEHGDAMEIIEKYDGPFDVVLIDHGKTAYADAFRRVIDKVRPGGVVVADNIMDGPVWYEDLLPYLETDDGDPGDDASAGILAYLRAVMSHPDCHSMVLPIGNGLAVTTKLE